MAASDGSTNSDDTAATPARHEANEQEQSAARSSASNQAATVTAPDKTPFLSNAAGLSFIVSSTFLLLGAVYNIGLFFLIDLSLVSAIPLADHVTTSISISLTLIAMGVVLLLVTSVCLTIMWGAVSIVDSLAKFGRHAVASASEDPQSKIGGKTPGTERDHARQAVAHVSHFLTDHFLIVYPAIANVLVFVFVYLVVLPDAFESAIGGLLMLLIIVGIIGAACYASALKTQMVSRGYLRLTGVAMLLYLIPFQLGVLESSSGLAFVYNADHGRPYDIGDQEAHVLRAGSNGVFYILRGPNESVPGLVQFQPWNEVGGMTYRLRPALD